MKESVQEVEEIAQFVEAFEEVFEGSDSMESCTPTDCSEIGLTGCIIQDYTLSDIIPTA